MREKTVFLCVFLLVLMFGFHARAEAPGPSAQKETSADIRELERTLELLEDPGKSAELAAQLRLLLEAKRLALQEEEKAEKEELRPLRISTDLFEVLPALKGKVSRALERIASEGRSLILGYRHFRVQAFQEYNLKKTLSAGINISVAFLVGFLFWVVCHRTTKRWKVKIAKIETLTLSDKIRRACLEAGLRVYPWMGLVLFATVIFRAFPVHGDLRDIVLLSLTALGVYFGARSLIYFLLSPEEFHARVFPLKNDLARYLYIWSRRMLLFSLWMVLLIIPCSVLGRTALTALVAAVTQIGWVILVAVILAQWKERIESALQQSIGEGDPDWRKRGQKIWNDLVGKLYLVVILYLAVVVAFSVLGVDRIYRFLVSATLKSLFVLALALTALAIWRLMFRRLFQVSATIQEGYAELAEQVNRYVHWLQNAGYLVIVLLAALGVLDCWGLDVYVFLGSNAPLVRVLVHIPLIVLAGIVLFQLSELVVKRLEVQAKSRMLSNGKASLVEVEKRAATLGRIIRKVVLVTVVTVTTMMVFAELGFDIKPILAGAGIVGLAVGFGAQNLVRDVISGLFLIAENRIRVGDVAILNGTGGLVEQVNLRTTVLRDLSGTVHVFPNGSINTLSNMTHEYSFYLFNIGVAYKEDTDRVIDVLREVGEQILRDEEYSPWVLEPLEILGVDAFADSAVVIKARIKTVPIKQWFVGREMNRRIKKRFDELGIEIPFPHRSLYFGSASQPIPVKVQGFEKQREALKEIVREVLEEQGYEGTEKQQGE